ncbi:MAG: tyrosine--tRNA ligase [Tepidisphaerales bacterium]
MSATPADRPAVSRNIAPADTVLEAIRRRVERVVPEAEFRTKLERSAATGRPLRLKFGMDPTAPDVTLGHAVPLKVLRALQDAGHKAVLIIGDYTARVGDPSGRNTTRPVLSGEQIDENARTYLAQVGKILRTDPEHLEVRFNGEWLGKMTMVDIIRLAARKSVAQLLAREDFAKRYAEGVDIRLHELMYPLLQGWDSVMVNADVEFGGSDQLFNNLVGRELQKEEGHEGQCVLVTPLLVGTDGVQKMSKSKGNYIGVTDPPGGSDGMFGKVMRIPDSLLEHYYQLLTDVPESEYRAEIRERPRDAKVRLARLLVSWLHSPEAADRAEQDFVAATHGGLPSEVPELSVGSGPHPIAPLLVKAGFVKSNGEGIRKVREGAIKVDGQRWADEKAMLAVPPGGCIVQMGSRRFVRLVP